VEKAAFRRFFKACSKTNRVLEQAQFLMR